MKNYLNLVPISAKIHRKQGKMTRICITLAVYTIDKSEIRGKIEKEELSSEEVKEMQENGNWHYEITSIDTKTATYISSRPEVEISGCQNIISSDEGCSVNGQNTAICSQNADF